MAASRTKHKLSIYITNEAELRKLAEQFRAKENASDYLDLFAYQQHRGRNAHNEIRITETHDKLLRPQQTMAGGGGDDVHFVGLSEPSVGQSRWSRQ